MKNKPSISNYTKAVEAVLNHFKSPVATVKAIAQILSDIDVTIELKSVWGENVLKNVGDLKYTLCLLQVAFCEAAELSNEYSEEDLETIFKWFTEPGNPERVYHALRSALIHHCAYYADYGISGLEKNLEDFSVLIQFATILHEEENACKL